MGIRYLKKSVTLQGRISAEEAEELQQWLKSQPRASVNVGRCEHMHAAVLQVLLALRPRVTGTPADPWLQAALAPRPQAAA